MIENVSWQHIDEKPMTFYEIILTFDEIILILSCN